MWFTDMIRYAIFPYNLNKFSFGTILFVALAIILNILACSVQQVDCYNVDADLAGLFAIENYVYPISVKSRTRYVVLYKRSPLLWVSKMQAQIALSIM